MASCNLTEPIEQDPYRSFTRIANAPERFGSTWAHLDLPARVPTLVPLPDWLHPQLAARVAAVAPHGVFEHQRQALEAIHDGTSVVIATPTGSGKSLCFQLPILDGLARAANHTSLILTPTKALASDQLRSLLAWKVPQLRGATFDGDASHEDRVAARRDANVLITNPDMLSRTLLPDHQRWARFFSKLRYVVIDEVHTLRGIFGSHAALTLARLERIAAHHGAHLQYISTSATLGDPGSFVEHVTGHPPMVISDQDAGRAAGSLVVWSRPLQSAGSDARAPLAMEASDLLASMVEAGHRTIVFAPTRNMAERITIAARNAVASPEVIATYRAGLLARERHDIERRLHSGALRAVVATSALELGVDLPAFSVVILAGFPGTLASFWQRIGRAGRDGLPSLAIMVEGNDQLDGFYRRHPDRLLSTEVETPVINRANEWVLEQHVGAAASELPISADDSEIFGTALDDAARSLMDRGLARMRGDQLYWIADPRDAPPPTLRGTGIGELELFDEHDTLLGTASASGLFVGAIYLHQGLQYEVVALDQAEHWARLRIDDREVWTQADRTSAMEVLQIDRQRGIGAGEVHEGLLRIRERLLGYRVMDRHTNKALERVHLDQPHEERVVRGIWITFDFEQAFNAVHLRSSDPSRVEQHPHLSVGAGLHAAEHALIGMVPRYAMADRWDLGGLSTADTTPSITVYEAIPGGTGITGLLYDRATSWANDARILIAGCGCGTGCPQCVQSPKCGNFNEYLDSVAAVALLDLLAPLTHDPSATTSAPNAKELQPLHQ